MEQKSSSTIFEEALEQVEVELHKLTAFDSPFCSDVTRSLVQAGGKRIRPRSLLALGLPLGLKADVGVSCAAAVELVHNGTLLQDDVIDESNLRRGQPTAWATWGTGAGVLGGNLLYTRAFAHLLSKGLHKQTEWLIEALHNVVVGEMLQQEQSWRLEPDEAALVHVARHKTGAFFGFVAMVIADAVSGNVALAKEWGIRLGYGFQLADDLLDFGDPIDKPVGSDLREGYQTLPVFRESCENKTLLALIEQAYASREESDFERAYAAIRESKIRENTLQELQALKTSLLADLNQWAGNGAKKIVAATEALIQTSFFRDI